jgi:hypothetical protein
MRPAGWLDVGICHQTFTFNGVAPSLPTIAEKVEARTGLPVVLTTSDLEPLDDVSGRRGYLAFARFPGNRVTIRSYRRPDENGIDKAGPHAVDLEYAVVGEPTIYVATAVALEALGGTPAYAISEESRQLSGGRIDLGELVRRNRKANREATLLVVAVVLLLPVLIPAFVGRMMWEVLTSESKLTEARKRLGR